MIFFMCSWVVWVECVAVGGAGRAEQGGKEESQRAERGSKEESQRAERVSVRHGSLCFASVSLRSRFGLATLPASRSALGLASLAPPPLTPYPPIQ